MASTIAVSRSRTATGRSGGPADPGLDTPSAFAAELPRSVREDYDLIGFDPRGVEYSTPQSCHLDDPNLFDYFPYPAANGSIAANVTLAKAVGRHNAEVDDAISLCAAETGCCHKHDIPPFPTSVRPALA